jgi:hypothetical protein
MISGPPDPAEIVHTPFASHPNVAPVGCEYRSVDVSALGSSRTRVAPFGMTMLTFARVGNVGGVVVVAGG